MRDWRLRAISNLSSPISNLQLRLLWPRQSRAPSPPPGGWSEERHESYLVLVWRKFRKSKIAIVGGLLSIMLIMMAVFADFLAPTDPTAITMQFAYSPPQQLYLFDSAASSNCGRSPTPSGRWSTRPRSCPNWELETARPYPIRFLVQGYEYKLLGLLPSRLHLYGVEEGGTFFLLGTDKFGRDLWGRICMAGRISIALALFGTFITITLGSVVGMISGYYGGWVDNLLQRFVEFVQSFPQLPLLMALSAVIPITWDQRLVVRLYGRDPLAADLAAAGARAARQGAGPA